MTLQPDAPETEAAPTDGRSVLSRRTVLRAGAHAAWAIPAVQVITQAPALAVSGSKVTATMKSQKWTGSTLTATATVSNTGTAPTDSISIQFSIGAPDTGSTWSTKPALASASSGSWTVASLTPNSASSATYTLVLTATAAGQLAKGTSEDVIISMTANTSGNPKTTPVSVSVVTFA